MASMTPIYSYKAYINMLSAIEVLSKKLSVSWFLERFILFWIHRRSLQTFYSDYFCQDMGILVVYCCIKNYPDIWQLKTTMHIIPQSLGQESGAAYLDPVI